jgi:hypothetical protein
VSGEVAVCLTAVGLAVRAELRVLELSGRRASLDALLRQAVGGEAPSPGFAHRVGGAWCARVDDSTAFVLGDAATVGRWSSLTHQAVGARSVPGISEASSKRVVLSLIGPRLGGLLVSLATPAAVATGSVRLCSIAGEPTVLIGENAGRALLVCEPDAAASVCAALFDAGRGVGLSLVGAEAIARLDVADCRRPAS